MKDQIMAVMLDAFLIINALPPKFLQKCFPPYFFHGAFAPSFIWSRRPCPLRRWHLSLLTVAFGQTYMSASRRILNWCWYIVPVHFPVFFRYSFRLTVERCQTPPDLKYSVSLLHWGSAIGEPMLLPLQQLRRLQKM